MAFLNVDIQQVGRREILPALYTSIGMRTVVVSLVLCIGPKRLWLPVRG